MQAPDDKSGIPLWAKIGYVPFAALIALIAYRIGPIGFGHAVVILLAFIATWFIEPKARRLVRLVHILVSMTLLLSTAFIQFLNASEQAATIEGNRLLNFLIGGAGAKALVSIVAALIINAALLVVPMFIVAYVSSEWILAMRQVYGVTRKQALRLLFSMFFNTSYPYYVVEDGEITQTKPSGLLPVLGGPGVAVVKPYNAVVFERSGNITRVEGPGMFMTKRFEFIKQIVSLRKHWMNFTAENVLTKDHVPLTFECGIGFRIEARKDTARRVEERSEAFEGSRFVGIIGGDYPVYKRTIYRAVYNTTAAGWKTLSQGATETQLRVVLREYLLEDLYRLQDDRLDEDASVVAEIERQTRERVAAISHTWGVAITGFRIKSFAAPEDVKKKLLEMWAAEYERYKLQIMMQSEADALRLKAQATSAALIAKSQAEAQALYARSEAETIAFQRRSRAEEQALGRVERVRDAARQQIIEQIRQGLGRGLLANEAIATRFIAAIEQISRHLVSDSLGATRYIEMLEKIAESEGTKTLIIGEERGRLGPGERERTRD